jgi:putative phage-type endonuclease
MFTQYVQGTPEWLAARKGLIGASEIAAIMGESPWDTPRQMYEKKIGSQETADTSGMAYGRNREDMIVEEAARALGLELTKPNMWISDNHPWLCASFDAISSCGRFIVEAKVMKEEWFNDFKEGKMPRPYEWQTQGQLAAHAGIEKGYMAALCKDQIHIGEFVRDEAMIIQLLGKTEQFDKMLKERTPPPLTERDYRKLEHLQKWQRLADEAKTLKNLIDQAKPLECDLKKIRLELIDMADGSPAMGCGIRIRKEERQGTLNFDAMPLELRLTLEQYRNSPVVQWKLTFDVEGE